MCTSKTLPKKDRFIVSDVDDIIKNSDRIFLFAATLRRPPEISVTKSDVGKLVQEINEGKEDIVKN